jgi:eukaryotic-like serine/threonine-protein kinase
MDTDVWSGLQHQLGAAYQLERELGRGGMAVVYLASDLKHGRSVALKVLDAQLAAGLGADRFRREIALVARLQHPNILPVFDSGETASGQLWFTMPYVAGETLRQRLRRDGALPVDAALGITREIADALAYAHAQRIIHRDVKPENILLSQGHAMLADFGIARPVTPTPRTALTETGYMVGTPAYASPEQVAGLTVDERSDIYSLGAVCYEMLTGELPQGAPGALASLAEQIMTGAGLLRVRRPAVSAGVETAIRTALAPIPAQRHASVAAFVHSLDAPAEHRRPRPVIPLLAAGLALVAAGALAAWGWHGSGTPPATMAIAVLPFENIGDSANAYFTAGVTDEVRGKLAGLPGLRVIARASSAQYGHTTKPPEQIASELHVQYLLTGRVLWERLSDGRQRVRVDPELIQVEPNGAPTTKWQQPFDADLSDVFQVQAAIAERVASALDIAIGVGDKRVLAQRPTTNLAAYDAYLKGEAVTAGLSAVDPPSLRRSLAFYDQSVALDSTFAGAWARIAYVHAVLFHTTGPSAPDANAAQRAIARVNALAPNRPEAYLALAAYEDFVRTDPAAALAAAKALPASSNDVDLLALVATAERELGQWDNAVAHFTAAEMLDPRSAIPAYQLGRTLQALRRLPEAQSAIDRARAVAPTSIGNLHAAAMIAAAGGDVASARAIIRQGLATNLDTSAVIAFFATYYDLAWLLDAPEQMRALRLSPGDFDDDRATWALVRAEVYALRGDSARARAFADTAERVFAGQLRATPDDDQLHAGRGLALAYLGRASEAIREGERAVALRPLSRDAFNGPYIEQLLARIDLMSGRPDAAIDHLIHVTTIPYFVTTAWLRVDPTWDSLRGNPRFPSSPQ